MKYFILPVIVVLNIAAITVASNIPTTRLDYLEKLYNTYATNSTVALKLVDEVEHSPSKVDELVKLYNFLAEKNGLFSVAGLLLGGKLMDLSGVDPRDEIVLTDIRNKLPEVIKEFPWNGEIRMRNDKTGRYMCESINKFPKTSYNRLIMANRYYDGSNCAWIVEMDLSGKSVQLRNKESNQYIFAGGDGLTFSEDQRNVLSMSVRETVTYPNTKDTAKWQFTPLESGAYRISNLFFDEYLYNLKDAVSDTLFTKNFCSGIGCVWTIEVLENYETSWGTM